MGKLIAKNYPTKLFLKAADHTYVECGTGAKSWSCWGGNSGGQFLNSGFGSTQRANEIAEPDERAGITRYLIDGVCHQAANRILLPAKILVSQARGYRLSSAIFGTYGKSPFNQFQDISGDLSECYSEQKEYSNRKKFNPNENEDLKIISANLEIYNKYARKSYLISSNLEGFSKNYLNMQSDIFSAEIEIWGAELISNKQINQLIEVKYDFEHKVLKQESSLLLDDSKNPIDFIRAFNKYTNDFQSGFADILNDKEYELLLKLNRKERLSLIDPIALDQAYGDGTYEKALL
ncbi:hypothetical protein [Acinetobacter oleivorans]|uniref:hypothetical protein n=1 Tax=Acinetobacter oleivorans TaxID=1148157 RepID=UPI00125ED20F|nr:hypothetical protein [Acinetobacter oleivorans]